MRKLETLLESMMEGDFQESQEIYQAVWDVMMEIPAFDMMKDAQFAHLSGKLANDPMFQREAEAYLEPDGTYNFDPDFIRAKAWDVFKKDRLKK